MEQLFFWGDKSCCDIKPMYCGREDCAPSHKYGPNVRQQYLIHYIESGKGRFLTDDKEYKLSAGDMFFIRPGEITTYEADKKTPWSYKWVGFECAFDISDIFCKNVVSSEKCGIIFSEICESEKYGEFAALYACGKIYELIASLRLNLSAGEKHDIGYAQKAKYYIETNYYKNMSVSELARELGLDRSYLSVVFKALTGMSPKEYMVDYRLRNAADLMTQYDFSPKQASASCGYDDIFNFSKMFKKKYGISPREYKAQRKK